MRDSRGNLKLKKEHVETRLDEIGEYFANHYAEVDAERVESQKFFNVIKRVFWIDGLKAYFANIRWRLKRLFHRRDFY